MGSPSNTNSGVAAVKADYEAIKTDIKNLQADLSSLVADTGRVAGEEARRQAERASRLASGAGRQLASYRGAVEDKVRDHPFAAIGLAMAAGFIVASLMRRN